MLAAKRNQKNSLGSKSSWSHWQYSQITILRDILHSMYGHTRAQFAAISLPGYHANKQKLLWQPHYNASDASVPGEVSEPVNHLKRYFLLTFYGFLSRALQLVNLGKTKKHCLQNPKQTHSQMPPSLTFAVPGRIPCCKSLGLAGQGFLVQCSVFPQIWCITWDIYMSVCTMATMFFLHTVNV